jgi:multiple sugar transport system ATP-binding protein
MATVTLDHISKEYPNGTLAVNDLSLQVGDGEFLVLVGPSGSGKTTALRMVAGLEDVSHGVIRVGDRDVTALSPRDRDIAMVFQNYALYPHMTVAENVGFSLTLHHVDKKDIRRRVEDAARILGLTEYLDRKPAQLSGGQRQRVAMGRAIVREPAAFLMDEPLSNLDAKLRVQTRAEVLRIQRRLAVATLYVTHDQTEAMTMGDRVAVLRGGVLQQCDAPQVLYDHPANVFVAGFMGSPSMNIYEAELTGEGNVVRLGSQTLELPTSLASAAASMRGGQVVIGVRPEDLHDASASGEVPPGRRFEGDVDLVESLGAEKIIHLRVDAMRVQVDEPLTDASEDPGALRQGEIGGAALTECIARTDASSKLSRGDHAVFAIDTDRLHLFDPATGVALRTP